MFFSLASYTAALVSLASVSQTLAAQIDVVVGGPGVLMYTPSSVTANVGDVVVFSFHQKNHTVTQSTLENPCQPAPGGFDSGFVFVDPANTNGPFQTATFTVKDTNPVWVYCRQGNHCQQGMVFAINPGDKFAQFQAAAMGGSAAQPPSSTDPYSGPYSQPPPAATTTPTASTTDHKIIVGGPGKLVYDPSHITAQVGDTVTFEFHQKNHTATQSSFANPCRSLTSTSLTGQVGLDSGFMPVADTATTFPTWTIQINDTAPLWFFCLQATHCGQGMLAAINSDESSSNNFAAFQARAKAINGTATNPPNGITPNGSNGAERFGKAGSGVLLAAIGVLAGLVL